MADKNEAKTVKFSNGTVITKDINGKFKIITSSEANKQTMPLDIEEDVSSGVPRDKSQGLDQTDKEYVEYSHEYELGDSGSDTDIVPRKNPSLNGQDAVEFEEEKSLELSEKSMGEFQTGKDNKTPEKAGSPDNHVASLTISKLKKEVANLRKELQKEKVLRSREAIARKTIELEVQSGILKDIDDEKFESEVQSRICNSSALLQKDYERVKNIYSMMNSGILNKLSSFNNINTSHPGIQKLDGVVEYLNDIHSNNYGASIESGVPVLNNSINSYSQKENLLKVASQTTLSRKFK